MTGVLPLRAQEVPEMKRIGIGQVAVPVAEPDMKL